MFFPNVFTVGRQSWKISRSGCRPCQKKINVKHQLLPALHLVPEFPGISREVSIKSPFSITMTDTSWLSSSLQDPRYIPKVLYSLSFSMNRYGYSLHFFVSPPLSPPPPPLPILTVVFFRDALSLLNSQKYLMTIGIYFNSISLYFALALLTCVVTAILLQFLIHLRCAMPYPLRALAYIYAPLSMLVLISIGLFYIQVVLF